MSEEKLTWEERGKGHTQKVGKCQHQESLMLMGVLGTLLGDGEDKDSRLRLQEVREEVRRFS